MERNRNICNYIMFTNTCTHLLRVHNVKKQSSEWDEFVE